MCTICTSFIINNNNIDISNGEQIRGQKVEVIGNENALSFMKGELIYIKPTLMILGHLVSFSLIPLSMHGH